MIKGVTLTKLVHKNQAEQFSALQLGLTMPSYHKVTSDQTRNSRGESSNRKISTVCYSTLIPIKI
jgi:hypothetical protein